MKRWIALFLFLTALPVLAIGCSGGELAVTGIWARSAASGQNGAVYFVIENQTGQDDTLMDVRGDTAEAVEVHLSQMDDKDVMTMERQESVSIPAKSSVEFKPGGLHVMLIGLKKDLQMGDTFDITLVFQNAGEININVPVTDQP
jgi:copper(I)-binding protein